MTRGGKCDSEREQTLGKEGRVRVGIVCMKQGGLNFLCSFCITLPTVSALGFLLPALPACLAVCLSVCLSLCLCPPLISLPVLASPCSPCTCLTPNSPLERWWGRGQGPCLGEGDDPSLKWVQEAAESFVTLSCCCLQDPFIHSSLNSRTVHPVFSETHLCLEDQTNES